MKLILEDGRGRELTAAEALTLTDNEAQALLDEVLPVANAELKSKAMRGAGAMSMGLTPRSYLAALLDLATGPDMAVHAL